MNIRKFLVSLCLLICSLFPLTGISQCMMVPVPLSKRVTASPVIILGKLKEQICYTPDSGKRIFTSNIIEVKAYLKGYSTQKEIIVISEGGILEEQAIAQIVYPSARFDADHEYVITLSGDNPAIDNEMLRLQYPDIIQSEVYACSQGILTLQDGLYHDLLAESPMPEAELFQRISRYTGIAALTPDGKFYIPRPTQPKTKSHSHGARINAITNLSPNPGVAGTVVAGNQLTITGSGFGAAAGTVEFSNGNDGGATFIQSPVPTTDIVSWADNQIVIKVPTLAGTGQVQVNGTFTAAYTVTYSHLSINNTFSGYASSTRHRYFLVNKSGNGGYLFQYNTGFAANAPAVAAFERALESWRCNTFVNFGISGTTSSLTSIANDGVNLVLFDATLPAGVLGRATTSFGGSANGACNLQNTVWYANDLDIQYQDPPAPGFTWNYGPGASVAFSTTYDFESVSVHELGHAHGLGHIISAGSVMHYALFNGADARTLSAASDIAGGNAKMTYSTAALCLTPAGVTGPMTALNSGNCALPVSMIYFKGNRQTGHKVLLEWATAAEQDNEGFELQRSSDGQNFETITFIQGAGNSTAMQHYRYTDYTSLEGEIYYRLIQTDHDGHQTSSRILLIHDEYEETHASLMFDAGDKNIYVSLTQPVITECPVVLYDMSGKPVLKGKIGAMTVSEILSAANIKSGVYYYVVQGADFSSKGKLLIQQVW